MPRSLRAKRSDADLVGMRVAQRWLDHHGQQARAWLDQAPDIARLWAQRWNLTVGAPLEGGSVSVVLSVEREDGPAVLTIDPNPCAGYQAYDAAQWAVTETPVADAPERAAAVAAALGIPADDVLRWVCVLTAVEVYLAPLARAEASLALAQHLCHSA